MVSRRSLKPVVSSDTTTKKERKTKHVEVESFSSESTKGGSGVNDTKKQKLNVGNLEGQNNPLSSFFLQRLKYFPLLTVSGFMTFCWKEPSATPFIVLFSVCFVTAGWLADNPKGWTKLYCYVAPLLGCFGAIVGCQTPFNKFMFSMSSLTHYMHLVEILVESPSPASRFRGDEALWLRIVHIFWWHDLQTARPVGKAEGGVLPGCAAITRAFLRTGGEWSLWASAAGLFIWVLEGHYENLPSVVKLYLIWLAFCAFMHTVDVGYQLPVILLTGHSCAPGMKSPYFTDSLVDFWGRRWNRVTGNNLKHSVYLPLVHSGFSPLFGKAAVFGTSGLIHVWPLIIVGLPLYPHGAMMMAFFLLHGAGVTLEKMGYVSPGRLKFVVFQFCAWPLCAYPVMEYFQL